MERNTNVLALVLTGRKSKGSAIVVDLFLDQESNAINGSTESACSRNSSASRGCLGGSCGDGHARNDGSCAGDSCACDDSHDGNELSDCVGDGGSDNSDLSSLSARALIDNSSGRKDGLSARNGQSLASISDESGGVDVVGVDDSGSSASNSTAGVSASCTASSSSTCVCTGSERGRKSDNRARSDHGLLHRARAVRKNCGASTACNNSRDAADSDSLAGVAGHRRRVDHLGDLGHTCKSGDIAGWVGWSRCSNCVASSVKIDSLGSRASLSDKLGDGRRRARVASLCARSCSSHSGQAEDAGEMNPRVHDDGRTKEVGSEGSEAIDLECDGEWMCC